MIISAQGFVGRRRRRGTVVPFLALLLVALTGFLALAIDLGMLVTAKTQTQHAADLAAADRRTHVEWLSDREL